MSKRKYTHISAKENEIIAMWEAGKSKREIAECLGLEKQQVKTG
jgi:DNA-binding CsgD family transcriptional regulator